MNHPDHRLVRAVLCAIMIVTMSPVQLLAQSVTPPARTSPPSAEVTLADPAAELETARELIKSGDYDRAIETLKGLIGQTRNHTETLREAYLLLIKTFVYVGNDFRQKEQGREISRLNYAQARALIKECLQIRDLRHIRPEPETDYPAEMVTAFKEVREQIFGSFRVTEVSPAGAVVLFDADTLRLVPGEEALGDVDLPVGKHVVVVRCPGYRDLTEEIAIAAGVTESRTYQLKKHRGTLWYATRAGAVLGVTAGLVAVLGNLGLVGTTTAQPLSGPPPPPTRAR